MAPLPETLGFEDEALLLWQDIPTLRVGDRYYIWPAPAGFVLFEANGRGWLCEGANILEVIALLHAAGMPMKSP